MIAFGSVVFEPEPYAACAEPGIRAAAEPDSAVWAFANAGGIARGYNLILRTAATRDDLEALVLVHPQARIDDPAFCAKVRTALADPEVAVVGCAGAAGADGLAWWRGAVHCGPGVRVRFDDHGGGEQPAYSWADPGPAPAEVDALDGFLLVLSPWAVRTLRFDEDPWLDPAFAVDLGRQARAAGRRLAVADLGIVLRRPLGLVGDAEPWMLAHQRLAEKWDDLPADGEDAWRDRARRAEARREAARAMGGFKVLVSTARIERRERELDAMLRSRGWRLTAPLRSANALRRRRSGQGAPDGVAGDRVVAGGDPRPPAHPGEALGQAERARPQ